MTAPRISAQSVPVECHAPHPSPGKPHLMCGQLLGYIDGPVTFAGLTARAPDVANATVIRCSRCKAWNHFTKTPNPENATDAAHP